MKRWTRRPEGSTWGDFGPDDEIGRLNLLTEEKVLQAVREVRAGKVFCLSLPLDLPGGNVLNPRRHPPALAPTRRDGQPYLNFQMSRLQEGAVDVLSDDQATLSLQYSTQWDGLSHVGALFDVQGDGRPGACTNGYAAGVDVLGGGDPAPMPAARPAPRMRAGSASAATRKRHAGPWRAAGLARAFGTGRTPVGRRSCRPRCTNSGSRWNPATCWCCAPASPRRWCRWTASPTRIAGTDGRGAGRRRRRIAGLDHRQRRGRDLRRQLRGRGLPARTSGPGHSILPLHHHCLFAGRAAGRTLVPEGSGRLAARAGPQPLPAHRAAAAAAGAVGSPVTPIATV